MCSSDLLAPSPRPGVVPRRAVQSDNQQIRYPDLEPPRRVYVFPIPGNDRAAPLRLGSQPGGRAGSPPPTGMQRPPRKGCADCAGERTAVG